MKPLDDLERKIGLAGAALGVALAVGMWAGGLLASPSWVFAGIALVLSGFLAYMAGVKRARVWTGAGMFLLAFGPWGAYALVGAPFLAGGMFVWFRGKPSPEEIERRRAERDAKIAERRAAKQAQRSGRGSGRGSGSDSGATGAGDGRRKPAASKRYTPPARKR